MYKLFILHHLHRRLFRGPCSYAAPRNARNMTTLREIQLRLKSVRNIEKITKSMKMIASTKLAKAQRAIQSGNVYGLANKEIIAHVPSDKPTRNKLLIVISDKGRCSISKTTLRIVNNAADLPLAGAESANDSTVDAFSPIMIIGDKSKAQLIRALASNIQLTFNRIPTFADAAGMADLITQSGVKYDSVVIVYNKFINAVSYEAAAVEVKGEEVLKESDSLKVYENEGGAALKDLAEFSLANAIYAALVEDHACQRSARRNAMDNAFKNAKGMAALLRMKYNRSRQATITKELVDIITGASALRRP